VNTRNGQVREVHQEEGRRRGRRQILRTLWPVEACGRCCGMCTRHSTTRGPSKVRKTGNAAFADFVLVAGIGRQILVEKYVPNCHYQKQQHIFYIYINKNLKSSFLIIIE